MVKNPSSRGVFANFEIKAPASSAQAHRTNTRKGLDEKAQQKASERTGGEQMVEREGDADEWLIGAAVASPEKRHLTT